MLVRIASTLALVLLSPVVTIAAQAQVVDVRVVETMDATIESRPAHLQRVEVAGRGSGPHWTRVLIVRDDTMVGFTPLVRGARIACAEPAHVETCRIHLLPRGAFWPVAFKVTPQTLLKPGSAMSAKALTALAWPSREEEVLGGFAGFERTGADISEAAALAAGTLRAALSPGHHSETPGLELFPPYWEAAAFGGVLVLVVALVAGAITLAGARFMSLETRRRVRGWMVGAASAGAFVLPVTHLAETLRGGPVAGIASGFDLFGTRVAYLPGRSGVEAAAELVLVAAAVLLALAGVAGLGAAIRRFRREVLRSPER